MSFGFPDQPEFTGFNQPRRVEARIDNLVVTGELPEGLEGACYRNGPDPRLPPLLGSDVNWNGDGLVTMWLFDRGRVDFRSRYVRTEKFLLERKARRALFGAYRNPFTDDPSVAGRDRTTANTSVYLHAGRLMAVKEDGLGYEIDPRTLRTRGRYDFGGAMSSLTTTAHPKVDPATGELFAFGYEARGPGTPDVAIQRVAADGRLDSEEFLRLPHVSFIHDWGVTADHLVLPVMPTITDLDRLRSRSGFRWVFDPDRDTIFGVMPRDAPVSAMRWFRGPACGGGGHFLNAYTEGGKVRLDGFFSERCQFPYVPNLDGSPFDPALSMPRLSRWTFDLSQPGDGYAFEELFPGVFMEMPVVDPRYQTRRHRYAFAVVLDRTRPATVQGTLGFGWNTLVRVDVDSRVIERYYVGDNATCQEPVFVPREPGAPEADGWLLTVLTKDTGRETVTELAVIDSSRLEAGPVATVHTPFRLHAQTHGFWADRSELAGEAAEMS